MKNQRRGMAIARVAGLAVSLFFMLPHAPLFAHDVRWEAERQKSALVLSIHYADGTLFAYEKYEILPPGSDTPFQTGRTDALGRAVFVPDRPGEWKIKFHSDDGHGGEAVIQVGQEETAQVKKESLFNRFGPALTGVSLLFGLFGIYMLFQRKRK